MHVRSTLFAAAAPCTLALALLFSAPSAHAQLSQEYRTCNTRATSTVQKGMCAQKELTDQDARLNKAYQQLMQQYGASTEKKTALRDEERSWLKRRDYDCKVDATTIDNTCIVTKTSERADELESKLKF